MSTPAVQLLASLLTVATLAGIVVLAVLGLLSRRGHASGLLGAVAGYRSPLCAAVTVTATAGSLYFSEIAHYVPCTLCWYQRTAMYPLAVVAVTATIRRETPTAYLVTLAAIGVPISAYHWLLERFPNLDTGACSTEMPCTLVWFEELGFVTLPFMALTAFVAVLTICLAPPKEPT